MDAMASKSMRATPPPIRTRAGRRWWRATRAPTGHSSISVRSTGVYCRPSCPARRPKPENVQFHATCEDAERAGSVPASAASRMRRALAEQQAAKVAEICRFIETADHVPTLDELARSARA